MFVGIDHQHLIGGCVVITRRVKKIVRTDNPEQSSLFQPTVADKCLEHFARQFLDGCQKNPGPGPMPEWLDDISYACLMLCAEHGDKLGEDTATLLTDCHDAADKRGITGIYDVYPWLLALQAVNGTIGEECFAIERLVGNLAHGNSGIRCYMLEVGWLVRKWLPRDGAAPRLLEDVAGTLGGWWLALGLCSYLFENNDDFWAYADAYCLEEARFESQYRDRLQMVRANGLGSCRCDLHLLDSRIRGLIGDFAMGLRCDA